MLIGGLSVLLMLKPTQSEIPILILLTVLGSIGLVSANNLLNMYVCLEFQTLAIFVLVPKRRGSIISLEGGLKYLFWAHYLLVNTFLGLGLFMLVLEL